MTLQLPQPPVLARGDHNDLMALSNWMRSVWLYLNSLELQTTTDNQTHSLDNLAILDTVTPATDGAQTVFTTSFNYRSNTLYVYRDQSYLIRGIDYTETTANTFTMTLPPDSDEDIRVSFIKQ